MLASPEFNTMESSTDNLLMKTVFLVGLATGNRASEIAAMSRHAISFATDNTKVTIPVKPGFLYKNQSLYRTPPNITIKALRTEDGNHHDLCPLHSLREWLERTASWNATTVFLNTISKKQLNRGSISHLIVRTINRAIPNAFAKGHDLRKVATSLAWARGTQPHEIITNTFWSSSNVFIKNYLSPVDNILSPCIAAGTMQPRQL